jgi:phosphomannomutase / phosphoglucomutase
VSIYKPCDIRGNAATELTPEWYRAWGRALGCQVEPAAKFVVGGDIRASTPAFLAALIDGLCEAGLDTVNLGLLPTPMIHYAHRRLHAAGCAIVTASRHPAEINGLKWMIGENPPTPDDVQSLQRETESGSARVGQRRQTASRSLDISFDYVAALQETWVDAMGTQCHVVLDPMHGCCAARARRYLHAIFPQSLFSTIHDTPDASLADHAPDCSRPELLEELCDAVYRERAHLGVAFDGDGDCVALVDNDGVVLTADEAAYVLLQSCGEQLRGERFVYDAKFSDRVPEAAKELGAEPLVERSGYAFLRSRMRQADALFGAGLSGHYFFRCQGGESDGLFTACWLVAYLARSGRTLSELRQECPPIYITPELRLPVEPSQQPQLIEQICAAWAEFPQQRVDGVRIHTPAGWILARSSVTEPALTFRFESMDWHALSALVERFCHCLPVHGNSLWSRYAAAMGTDDTCGE